MAGAEAPGRGHTDLSGGAADAPVGGGDRQTGLEESLTGGSVDSPINAPATLEPRVGRIDDGVGLLLDDVAQDQFDLAPPHGAFGGEMALHDNLTGG
jgi:hypothetical protein